LLPKFTYLHAGNLTDIRPARTNSEELQHSSSYFLLEVNADTDLLHSRLRFHVCTTALLYRTTLAAQEDDKTIRALRPARQLVAQTWWLSKSALLEMKTLCMNLHLNITQPYNQEVATRVHFPFLGISSSFLSSQAPEKLSKFQYKGTLFTVGILAGEALPETCKAYDSASFALKLYSLADLKNISCFWCNF